MVNAIINSHLLIKRLDKSNAMFFKNVSLNSMIVAFSEKAIMLMQLHYSRLSEKDRRHYAALESLKLGRGGSTYISKILGVDRKTILQGRKELTDDLLVFIPSNRQRKVGGGRKKNGSNPSDKGVTNGIDRNP
jgi:hypothetical protein